MHKIIFNEYTHTYHVDGIEKTYYSEIAQKAGLNNYGGMPPRVRERAFERGRDVHLICKMLLNRVCNVRTVDDEYMGYYNAYRDFRNRYISRKILAEMPLYNPELDYCCTPDQVVKLKKGKHALIEIKTGKMPKSAIMQLIANFLALPVEVRESVDVLIALQLEKEGTYKVWKCDVGSIYYEKADFMWRSIFDDTFDLIEFNSYKGIPFMTKMHISQGYQSLEDKKLERKLNTILITMQKLAPKVIAYTAKKEELRTLLDGREGNFKIGRNFTISSAKGTSRKFKVPQEIKDKYLDGSTSSYRVDTNNVDNF